MEHSSPLAAMQPPSLLPHFGLPPDSQLHMPSTNIFAPNFNFRDLSKMGKPSQDYFALGPVRGSSPTASLAADLSQNFHIDKSPQLPTPRRSLFTSNLFGAISRREHTTTPPLPSSSPGPGNDSMDMSPLPHKAPFSSFRIEIDSPTPVVSSVEMSMDTSSPLPSSPLDGPRANTVLERKKPPFLRPSLSRNRGSSTNSMSMKTNSQESQLPTFKFGTASSSLSSSISMSLGECFTESPPQDRKNSFSNPSLTLMGPPRMKQPFPSLVSSTRNGSPVYSHIRKPSAQTARPRKQFRRSLSMFEHPGDIMKEKDTRPTSGLQAIMDVDEYKLLLPCFTPEDRPDCLPRVAKETLVDVLDGKYCHLYNHTIIVDCRFEYEYDGGHIEGAVNYNDKELLAKKLFECSTPNTLVILHCEYSAHRAPIMAQFIRHHDRAANDYRYPKLTYPEVYILDGGYSSFYADYRARCYPQNYVEMGAKEHANTCEREMGRFRHRSKLNRAQTFAFGQQMDDSPTAAGKTFSDSVMMGTAPSDNTFDSKRVHTRRMASY
ncbi:MAG: cell division cycle- protein [Geoglossum umbratile]|nr:MAG: cell division cycle- protein [Geoglossum umbratile]